MRSSSTSEGIRASRSQRPTHRGTDGDLHRIRAPPGEAVKEKFEPSAEVAKTFVEFFQVAIRGCDRWLFGTIEGPLKISSGPGCQTVDPCYIAPEFPPSLHHMNRNNDIISSPSPSTFDDPFLYRVCRSKGSSEKAIKRNLRVLLFRSDSHSTLQT